MENKCRKCGEKVIVESTGNGGTRRTCQGQGCGLSEVVNAQGKKLLTDDRGDGGVSRATMLTEG